MLQRVQPGPSCLPGGTRRPWSPQGEPFWPSRHGEGCPDYRTMSLLSQQQRPSTAMAQLPNGERARIPKALQLTEECYDLAAGLAAGTVGTVVEVLPRPAEPVMCLVELSDTRGCGY